MKVNFSLLLVLAAGVFFGCESANEELEEGITGPQPVAKTNDMQVYMHYMPWYQGKETSGYWGSHWRMANKNPDNVDENGKREIASHYYPLIGPYDSRDPAVIEYHLLLMKYAGIDGVLIDWYGTHNVHDYNPNLRSSNALIENLDEVGLEFAIVYEEYTAESVAAETSKTAIEAAKEDLAYMQANYFNKEEYIWIDEHPLLMTFGPRYFKQESQWNQILEGISPDPLFLPLWFHSHRVGANGDGEFAWVDFNSSLSDLEGFYSQKEEHELIIGSAFPRFHDFYKEGGWGESYGRVYSNEGETLRKTLRKAQEHDLDYIQLVTWNDFGEGTVIEPTLEDEYLFLEIIQEFTGVPYGRAELELIYQYFLKKKALQGNEEAEEKLEQVFQYLVTLKVEQAKELLSQLP
ncbi:glycoside hydrolase family 71/99-like protein [Nafulsella turpanensis]|uniref:glycoside hydrolase family 71/99-like protein n=1 Tax=Nafulsella turpanensis TaxID=1265690 RepID=UPI0003448B0F|nr:glycoside hydrolase family 71/99-like protein [Nafulsella turpanensis]